MNWEKFYRKNAAKLIGVCRRYVKSQEQAEDLVHEGLLKAMQKIKDYRGEGAIEAWVRKIVVNEALQLIRAKARAVPHVSIHNDEFDLNLTQMDNETYEFSNFSQEELLTYIDELPQHHKSVFNMYVLDGYKHHEIAELLNISIGTSKSHLARARKNIRAKMIHDSSKEKKKRRFVAFIFPFAAASGNLDELFQSKFSDFKMEPKVSRSEYPFKNYKLFKRLKIALSAVGLATALTIVLFFLKQEGDGIDGNPDSDPAGFAVEPQNEIRDTLENSAVKSIVDDSCVTIEVAPASVESLHNETSDSMTKEKQHVPMENSMQEAKKKPVVIHKNVFVHDSVQSKRD